MQQRNIDHPVYIETDDELARLCEQWHASDMLAIDTEFIRTDTFYPRAALVQVSDGKGCFLIDALSIKQWQPLVALLQQTSIVKVLHSCGEDLEVFNRLLNATAQPVFDTQIAAALDGYGFSLGYQRLTQAILQVHIPKGETRSNWLQRPLSASQIHYAALDVAYLPQLYVYLQASLDNKGRLGWLQDECQSKVQSFTVNDTDHYYKKVKSAWKLSGSQLAVLRDVIGWRERAARERDLPRGRVLSDKLCYEIARLKPGGLKALAAIDDITGKTVRIDGDTLINLVRQGSALEASEFPAALPQPLSAPVKEQLKTLKALVKRRAGQLGIAQELLVKKSDYEALLRSAASGNGYQLPPALQGWRKAIIGDQLLSKCNTFVST